MATYLAMKKKILHVLWSGGIGGAEEYVTSLIGYFDANKYQVSVCFVSKKGDIFVEGEKCNKNYSFIGMKNGWDLCGALGCYLFLKKNKFDLIHVHSGNFLINVLILRLKNTKVIFHEHMSPGADKNPKKRKLFYLLFRKRFNKIIAISEFVKRQLITEFGVDSSQIEVIHNGIDLNKFTCDNKPVPEISSLSEGRPIIGFIARLEAFKRPELFIRTAESIVKRKKGFCFMMVGDGPEMQRCKELVANLKLDRHVHLIGFRRNISDTLKLFNALLFTSEGEGFGIVILEAMAMGVPVFAIDDGAMREIIKNNVNGFLIDRDSSPEKISICVLETMEDVSLIERVGQRAKEEVKSNYSIEKCASKISRIYENALKGL